MTASGDSTGFDRLTGGRGAVDFRLKGKVAMVAGASRGLGYAVARGLAREGVLVSMGSRDAASVADAGSRISAETYVGTLAMPVDVRSADSLTAWYAKTVEKWGGVDLLFVNAGGPPAGLALSFDDDAWQGAFELLVMSAIRMVRLAVPSMKARGGGAIVVSTSSAVKEPIPNLALSKTLANELAADGIRVNHLLPGRIDTDRVRELDEARAKSTGKSVDDVRHANEQQIPLGRYGVPSEFGSAAVFLFSNAASYITGASLQVDGGLIKHIF